MLHLYPANKTENLVAILKKLLTINPQNVMDSDIVVVQSKGMQHWLNMQLATESGIAMNIEYPMPAQLFWQTLRQILGREQVPNQQLFSRDVLVWRLYNLMASQAFAAQPQAIEAINYITVNGVANASRRYQLALQVADLFEQYLIYRSDWLDQWRQQPEQHWQALLWHLLTADNPFSLTELLKSAKNCSPAALAQLPTNIYLFGINTLPPLILDFLDLIGQQRHVHILHLNPCESYWGDILSDQQRGKMMQRWLDTDPLLADHNINPLLANLGQQGREFLALLPNYQLSEITAFEPAELDNYQHQATVLQCIQNDILTLTDGRLAPQSLVDDSIQFVRCYSRLREIQGLHDWLLHQFNADPTLTPKDILVMCPQVEDYAPYIEAVFTRAGESFDPNSPPLPCSIADRTLKNTSPLVAMFEQLLSLPDSRFRVNEIMTYLKLPAVQLKFGLVDEQIVQFEQWLATSGVHWGIDNAHKDQVLGRADGDGQFSWQQGLMRLLNGFAYSDQDCLVQDHYLLGLVEGDDALTLGRLLHLFDLLRQFRRQMTKPRVATEWHALLTSLCQSLFEQRSDDQQSWQIIKTAIDNFSQFNYEAGNNESLPLTVVQQFFSRHFATADASQQFLTGQVTFCSMVPMRSIPFKIIAVLGLNDGEFPRIRSTAGFDLIAQSPPRLGDRSRRADDRYLFLEALISCRQSLYLSYLGMDVKTGNARQPAVVVQELMDYLEIGYNWSFSELDGQLATLPLQPYSPANYRGDRASFNKEWLRLASAPVFGSGVASLLANQLEAQHITQQDLALFFADPLRSFANQQLNLFFNDPDATLHDDEPFAIDSLTQFKLCNRLVELKLNNDEGQQTREYMTAMQHASLLPQSHLVEQQLQGWQTQAELLVATLFEHGYKQLQPQQLSTQIANITLSSHLQLTEQSKQFCYKMGPLRGKNLIDYWLRHVVACTVNPMTSTYCFGFETSNGELEQIIFQPIEQANDHLHQVIAVWQKGHLQPLPLNADFAHALFTNVNRQRQLKYDTCASIDQLWLNQRLYFSAANNAYSRYFFPNPPDWLAFRDDFVRIYQPLYQNINDKFDLTAWLVSHD